MKKMVAGLAVMMVSAVASGETVGWLGDGTGKYPDATPTVRWSRTARASVVKTLRCQAGRPKRNTPKDALAIPKGHPLRWLVLGTFDGDDVKDLDKTFIANETDVQPSVGDRIGALEWKAMNLLTDTEYNDKMFWAPQNESEQHYGVFGRKVLGKVKGKVFYAHTYVWSERKGDAVMVTSHLGALKVLLNGKEVFRSEKANALWGGSLWMFTRHQDHRRLMIGGTPGNPRVPVTLKKGWNRLLFKCVNSTEGKYHASLYVCFVDKPDTAYETTNVRWVTRLPDWGISSPIVVKDRIFLSCEPDLLLCLDKMTGKILWTRSTAIYHAVTDEDRAAHPDLMAIVPLAAKVENPKTPYGEKPALRKQIQTILHKVDKKKYAWPTAKSVASTGLTFPTPVSDGEHVWVFYSNSIAACYDLAGNRRWIRNLIEEIAHSPTGMGGPNSKFNVSAPILVGDKLVLQREYLAALDKRTGKTLWKAPQLHGLTVDKWHDPEKKSRYNTNFSSTPTSCRIGGEDVIVCGCGAVVRARDGKLLTVGDEKHGNIRAGYVWDGKDTVWAFSGGSLLKMTFDGKPDGAKLQRIGLFNELFFAAPLVHEGLVYLIGIRGFLTVRDAATGEEVYRKQLAFEPFFFGWTFGCCSIPTLGGKYIYLMDNQLNTIVIKPGRTFEQVARNHIDNFLARRGPERQQDSVMINPVFDGDRIYIRGERDLFCIGTAD